MNALVSSSDISYAFAINPTDLVVGESQTGGGWEAFRTYNFWVPSTDILVPLQGKINCEALGVNGPGVAVGDSDGYATLWQVGGSPTPLALNSSTGGQCWANAINDNGMVVGYRASGPSKIAVAWLNYTNSVTSVDLLSLNPTYTGGGTWTLVTATAVNDQNWIVGWGTLNGQEHAFLMAPKQVGQ